jgi:hypothetical protein
MGGNAKNLFSRSGSCRISAAVKKQDRIRGSTYI